MTRHTIFIVTHLAIVGSVAMPLASQNIERNDEREKTFTLIEAVQLGLNVDPRTAAAQAQQEATQAGVRAAKANLLPSVFAEGTATRFQQPMIVAPLHRFDPTAPPLFSPTLFQSRWTAAYTLFDGGVRRADIQNAQAANEVSSARSDGVEIAVIQAVVDAFVSVVSTSELLVAEERRLNSLRQERARAQQLFDVGRTPRVTLLRADAAIANAEASNVGTEQQYRAAWRQMSHLLRMAPDSLDQQSLVSLGVRSNVAIDEAALLRRALATNPQIVMSSNQVALKRAEEKSARAAWLPNVQLAAGVVTYAGSGVSLTGEWQGGVSVSYPIFTGGARSHRIAGATAAREAAEADAEATRLDVSLKIEGLVARVRESRARVDALRAAVTYAQEVLRIEQLALSAGAGVQTDFLEAEADLFDARANLVRATHGEVTAMVALAAVTGDLSLQWLEETVENRQ